MATDNSPVQNRLIIIVGAMTVITLVGLKFVFDSYFASMTDEVLLAKLAPPNELLASREADRKKLAGGTMPIDKAMAELAAKGRTLDSLGPDLAPRQSDDLGPMAGWVKLPRPTPRSELPAPAGDAGATTVPPAPDAGVHAAAGDAAAPAAPKGDAGAPAAPKSDAAAPLAPQPAPHGDQHP
jgi:hypothetical protein